MEKTELLLQKLRTLKTLLGKEELILTGSLALAYHGLLDFSEANDLDLIVVNPSTTALDVLNKFQAENPSKKWKEGSPVTYSFILETLKIDVWVATNFEDSKYLVTEDGVKIASIKHIVKAKKSYNRPKDYIQLMNLANKIFNEQEFKQNLSSINTSTDEYPEVV